MEQGKGLIIGIDIDEDNTQAGYYDAKLGTVVSVNLSKDKFEYKNPVALSEILSGGEDGQADVACLSRILGTVIRETMRVTDASEIESVCVTLPDFDMKSLNAVKDALSLIGVKDKRWQIISRQESFAYYAFSQKKELYQTGVTLMNYDEEGIHCERLLLKKKDGKEYLLQEREDYVSDSVISAGRKEMSLTDIEDELCNFTEKYFEKRVVSSAYLTGKGFDVESLPPRFAKMIITRRKAFVGQNLYAKGACYAAMDILSGSVFKDVVVLLEDRIKVGIEIDISQFGQPKRFRIVRAGTNWYMAERTIDFILDDYRSMILNIVTPDNKMYEEVIDISEIPYREGKTTRVSFNIKFTAPDRCYISIKDKGFGDFVKSSGKVVYKELEFSE